MHFISITDMNRPEIDRLLDRAASFDSARRSQKANNSLEGYVLALAFFQPSTRTSLSFQVAMLRLGGDYVCYNHSMHDPSSYRYPESLRDIALVLSEYADVAAVRHPAVDAVWDYKRFSTIPVINAGNGIGPGAEHPTQALLDLYTIRNHLGRLDGLSFLLLGELHQRTARSLILALSKYSGNTIYLFHPPGCGPSSDELQHARENGACEVICEEQLKYKISSVDVIYHCGTRKKPENYLLEEYSLTGDALRSMRQDAILMNPLPRNPSNVPYEIDNLPQARYFQQSAAGVQVRMAILEKTIELAATE